MLAIYGKNKGDKKFQGFNVNEGALVHNKIHITMFDKSQYEEIKSYVKSLNNLNKNFTFEIREI